MTATAAPVNLTNLTVDGTGIANSCANFVFGIFYAAGSGGTINNVTTRNQFNAGCGFGILGKNGAGATQQLTIQNSTARSYDAAGIIAGTNQSPPTLNATIKSNYVPGGFNGIFASSNFAGSITGNIATGNTQGNILAISLELPSSVDPLGRIVLVIPPFRRIGR